MKSGTVPIGHIIQLCPLQMPRAERIEESFDSILHDPASSEVVSVIKLYWKSFRSRRDGQASPTARHTACSFAM
jgi:hypothetical protein